MKKRKRTPLLVNPEPKVFKRRDYCGWCKGNTRQALHQSPCSGGEWHWRCSACEKLVDHPAVKRLG